MLIEQKLVTVTQFLSKIPETYENVFDVFRDNYNVSQLSNNLQHKHIYVHCN